MVSISKDYDLIDSFLNRRRQVAYTDKYLDQLLQDSNSSSRFSFQPSTSNTNISGIRCLDEMEEHPEHLLSGSEMSEKVLFQHMSASEPNLTIQNNKELDKKPLESFFMIKALKEFFNIRSGSATELVVNGFFNVFRVILWAITHPRTRALLCQIGMKIFELIVAIILAGIMILMSLITCGKDLETKDNSSKGKEMVMVSPREIIRNPKPSTSHFGSGLKF